MNAIKCFECWGKGYLRSIRGYTSVLGRDFTTRWVLHRCTNCSGCGIVFLPDGALQAWGITP